MTSKPSFHFIDAMSVTSDGRVFVPEVTVMPPEDEEEVAPSDEKAAGSEPTDHSSKSE